MFALDAPWWLYRSVRKADAVHLSVVNDTASPLTVAYAFSGAASGGSIAPVLHPEVIARFPLRREPSSADVAPTLAPGAALVIRKDRGSNVYTLHLAGEESRREGRDVEQILLFPTDPSEAEPPRGQTDILIAPERR